MSDDSSDDFFTPPFDPYKIVTLLTAVFPGTPEYYFRMKEFINEFLVKLKYPLNETQKLILKDFLIYLDKTYPFWSTIDDPMVDNFKIILKQIQEIQEKQPIIIYWNLNDIQIFKSDSQRKAWISLNENPHDKKAWKRVLQVLPKLKFHYIIRLKNIDLSKYTNEFNKFISNPYVQYIDLIGNDKYFPDFETITSNYDHVTIRIVNFEHLEVVNHKWDSFARHFQGKKLALEMYEDDYFPLDEAIDFDSPESIRLFHSIDEIELDIPGQMHNQNYYAFEKILKHLRNNNHLQRVKLNIHFTFLVNQERLNDVLKQLPYAPNYSISVENTMIISDNQMIYFYEKLGEYLPNIEKLRLKGRLDWDVLKYFIYQLKTLSKLKVLDLQGSSRHDHDIDLLYNLHETSIIELKGMITSFNNDVITPREKQEHDLQFLEALGVTRLEKIDYFKYGDLKKQIDEILNEHKKQRFIQEKLFEKQSNINDINSSFAHRLQRNFKKEQIENLQVDALAQNIKRMEIEDQPEENHSFDSLNNLMRALHHY